MRHLVLLMAALVPMTVGCASKQQVNSLEERVSRLETSIQQRPARTRATSTFRESDLLSQLAERRLKKEQLLMKHSHDHASVKELTEEIRRLENRLDDQRRRSGD